MVSQAAAVDCMSSMPASCQPVMLTLTLDRTATLRPCFRLRGFGHPRGQGDLQPQPTSQDIMTVALFVNGGCELERFLWSAIRKCAQCLSSCICWIEHAEGITVLPRFVLDAHVRIRRPQTHTVAWMLHTARVEWASRAIANVCREAANELNAERSFAVEAALRGTRVPADVKRLIKAFVREAVATDVVCA